MPHYTDYRDPQYHNHPYPVSLTSGGRYDKYEDYHRRRRTHKTDKVDKTEYRNRKRYGGTRRNLRSSEE